MTAGIATLEILAQSGTWQMLEEAARRLSEGIGRAAQEAGVPIVSTRAGTMFTTFFTGQPVRDWPSAKTSDTLRFGKYFRAMLENGVYLAPSQFEAGFVSSAHTPEIIDQTIEAARRAFETF
jgi:glutamate-1-semialdehyde 2,1-aminomutase